MSNALDAFGGLCFFPLAPTEVERVDAARRNLQCTSGYPLLGLFFSLANLSDSEGRGSEERGGGCWRVERPRSRGLTYEEICWPGSLTT